MIYIAIAEHVTVPGTIVKAFRSAAGRETWLKEMKRDHKKDVTFELWECELQ